MGAANSRYILTNGRENAKIKYAVSSLKGLEDKQHDAFALVPDLDHTTSFFGLYDGHSGPEVAHLCARLFHIELRAHPNYEANLNNAMRSVFSRMDEVLQRSNEWRELVIPAASRTWIRRLIEAVVEIWHCKRGLPYIPPQYSGCSATVVVARGSRVTVGNVGDCRCVASRNGQAIQLSTDHIPRNRGERRRIQSAGGKLERDRFVEVEARGGPVDRTHRAVLSTSRSIGTFAFKQNKNLPPEEQLVICNPDIHSMEITDDVEFLVIANFGVWYYMTPQEVVDFVHEQLGSGETDLRVICRMLLRRILPAVLDATVVLIQFKPAAPDAPEGSEEDSNNQEVKPDAGDEEQPSAPDREKVSRSKQREHKGGNLSGATAQSSSATAQSSSLRRRVPS